MMNKMKNMPGMGNIQSMLSKMGLGNLGGKVNTGAMEANMNQKMKMAKLKEKIRTKAELNAKNKLEQQLFTQQQEQKLPSVTEEELLKIFSEGEKVERTPRGTKPIIKNKKKKGKK